VADLLFFETVDAQKVGKTPPVYGTPHPDTKNFKDHKLCFVKQADPNGLMYEYYYAAERASQDDYNFEYAQADLGGNKYDTVVRTYVTLRSDFNDTTDAKNPKAGDTMPDVPANQFDQAYVLLTRRQRKIGQQELDSLFVVEQRTYFFPVDIVSQALDQATGGVLETKVSLFYRKQDYNYGTGIEAIETAADNPQRWGLNTSGVNKEVQQLSEDWFQVTARDVIPSSSATSVQSSKLVRSYYTNRNFTWPSVVDSLEFTSIEAKNGSTKTSVVVRNKDKKDGFSGPTKMQVLQYWRLNAFTESELNSETEFKINSNIYPFRTSSATYSGAQFGVSVRNVLTEAITLTDFIGTGHPVLKLGEYGFPKPWCRASTPTDWPSSAFVVSADQRPFRGGYLLEVVKVSPPAV
tara:strand:+ start:351 stop:1571 length:1221 start_codon:yes stop_codon:yes gene_type:complete